MSENLNLCVELSDEALAAIDAGACRCRTVCDEKGCRTVCECDE